MVLSHRNHGNFSKKVTCFLNPNQKEKPKCQDFSKLKMKNYELCIVNCGVPIVILLPFILQNRTWKDAGVFLFDAQRNDCFFLRATATRFVKIIESLDKTN